MSFESAWGFDPNAAIKAKDLTTSEMETDECAYSAEEQKAARIPSNVWSQVYELRRLYRK